MPTFPIDFGAIVLALALLRLLVGLTFMPAIVVGLTFMPAVFGPLLVAVLPLPLAVALPLEVFLMSQKAPFPRGFFRAHEKLCFGAVHGLNF